VSAQPAAAPIPVESAQVESRIVSVGSYLLSAATTFFFISFLFAFLYLRALNSNGLWAGPKPGHHVPTTLTSGIAILACVLVSVLLARVALAELRGRGQMLWWPAGVSALLLGLAAVAIQCWQYTDLAFGTSEGGYADVYLGWTGFFTIFAFGAMLWLETILATARRAPSTTPARPEPDLAGFSVFWTTLGLVEIAAFVLLYGVK
jgi:heme/copper-type cytochrome/quinol oxidase subunit 3